MKIRFNLVATALLCLILASCQDDIDKPSKYKELEAAFKSEKVISKIASIDKGRGWTFTFTDNTTVTIENRKEAVTPLYATDDAGFWMCSTDGGDTYTEVKDPEKNSISSSGMDGTVGGLFVRVFVNQTGNYVIRTHNYERPLAIVGQFITGKMVPDGLKVHSIVVDEKSGQMFLTMNDGSAFDFRMDPSTPFDLAPLNGTGVKYFALDGHRQVYALNDTFYVQVPEDADVTSLQLSYKVAEGSDVIYDGSSVSPSYSKFDFTDPVRFIVEAKNGEKKEYTVCATKIPVLVIETPTTDFSHDDFTDNIKVGFFEMDSAAKSYSNCMMKGRGNSSWWNMPKHSFTIKLQEKARFAGLKKHKSFALVANYCDKTLIRNQIAYEMGRKVYTNLDWNPRTQQTHMFVNGEYEGIYCVTETPRLGSKRVDIPDIKDCPSVEELPNYGFLMEVDARVDQEFTFRSTHWVEFALCDPDGDKIPEEYRKYIQEKIQSVEDAIYSSKFNMDGRNHYSNFIDVDSFIDWYFVNEIAKNNDAIFHTSVYMYYDPADGLMHMGPSWDFDIGYGNVNYNDNDKPSGFWVRKAAWISRLFEDPEFAAKARARWDETKPALDQYMREDVPAMADVMCFDSRLNFKRWPVLGEYVWANPDGYARRRTYESELKYLTDFTTKRINWLDNNL